LFYNWVYGAIISDDVQHISAIVGLNYFNDVNDNVI